MKTRLLAALIATISLSSLASEVDDFKERFALTYPKTPISSVESTVIPGVYEVTMGRNIAYVSEDARYFLFGTLYDMKTSTDLTANKRELASHIDFDTLPLKDAIVITRGNGKRKMAIFTDPSCPYCLALHKELLGDNKDKIGVQDTTIYVFLFPIESIHPQAKAQSNAIWCAKDPVKALNEWFTFNGVMPKDRPWFYKNTLPSDGKCNTPVDSTVALGMSFGINGTPSLIFQDGRLISGMRPAAEINKLLGGD